MTAEEPRKRGLGRGLSALFGDEGQDYAELDKVRGGRTVPVEALRPGKYQPRRRFSEEEMDSLVASVREKGIIQPILVRRDEADPNRYEIIAGERRWRAAQQAQLHEVPVLVRELSDRDSLEIALIENVQRQDLSALEEAEGYRRLMDEFEHTQEDLARAIGKSRSHVANTMRLLGLPVEVRDLVEQGSLTAGHARALLACEDPLAVARDVAARRLNVRQTEQLVQKLRDGSAGDSPGASSGGRGSAPASKDSDTLALERELSGRLGLAVSIQPKGPAGEVLIRYRSLEQLDDLVQRLSQKLARA